MSADVIPLNRAEPEGSIEPMLALTAQGMNRVNQVILGRMQSQVHLIPELAGHLIAGGGKRMRPMRILIGIMSMKIIIIVVMITMAIATIVAATMVIRNVIRLFRELDGTALAMMKVMAFLGAAIMIATMSMSISPIPTWRVGCTVPECTDSRRRVSARSSSPFAPSFYPLPVPICKPFYKKV